VTAGDIDEIVDRLHRTLIQVQDAVLPAAAATA
jgi:hypothetical protein